MPSDTTYTDWKLAIFDDETMEGMERAAKDPVTGEAVKVPRDMTYKEWVESFETEQMREYKLKRKMAQNRAGDLNQHAKYIDQLGEIIPKSLEDFQKLKYTDLERWSDLQYYAEYKGDRPLYCVQIDRELLKLGIGKKGLAYPPDQITVVSWDPHAIGRMQGSGATEVEVLAAKASAKVRFRRFPEPETLSTYYHRSGIVGVRERDGVVKTVIWPDRNKSDTMSILEVIDKYVR